MLLLMAVPTLVQMNAVPTKAQTEAFVKEAISFYKKVGKDQAIKVFTNPGPFHRFNGELYIFVYDMKGTVVAHGQGASKIGVNQSQAKDPDGKEFIKERLELAKTKGRGWHDYKFWNPTDKAVQDKTSYIEVYEGLIFGAGIYKD